MTPMRYVMGSIWVAFIGLSAAVLISFLEFTVEMFLYGEKGVPIFWGLSPFMSIIVRLLPGLVIGFLAARHSWCARVGSPMGKGGSIECNHGQ